MSEREPRSPREHANTAQDALELAVQLANGTEHMSTAEALAVAQVEATLAVAEWFAIFVRSGGQPR